MASDDCRPRLRTDRSLGLRDSRGGRIERAQRLGVGGQKAVESFYDWDRGYVGNDPYWRSARLRPATGHPLMVGATPQPSAAAEYDRQYRAWLDRQGPRVLDLEWRLGHLLWRHRVLLRRYPPEGKRVLDFGCMDGVFTLRMQQLGAEAVGYDISPSAIAQAEKFRGPAQHPTFTTVPPGPGQFDLVYCNEVLEHVLDDSAFVGEVVQFLAPGGMLVGTTPVGKSFWDPDHKRLYDGPTLERALSPWGAVRIRRYYRTPLRNLLPLRQSGAAVFIFEVRPPSLRDAR